MAVASAETAPIDWLVPGAVVLIIAALLCLVYGLTVIVGHDVKGAAAPANEVNEATLADVQDDAPPTIDLRSPATAGGQQRQTAEIGSDPITQDDLDRVADDLNGATARLDRATAGVSDKLDQFAVSIMGSQLFVILLGALLFVTLVRRTRRLA